MTDKILSEVNNGIGWIIYNNPERRNAVSLSMAEKVAQIISDHTENIYTSLGAVALGARIIEKHFTLDKQMNGPDHSSSMNPKEFKNMVTSIRETEILLGSEKIEPSCKQHEPNPV